MAERQRASERIVEEVTTWLGVVAGPGARGEFSLGSDAARSATCTATTPRTSPSPGRSGPSCASRGGSRHHPVFPDRVGPAARRIAGEADVRDVIALMRLNYDRAVARHGPPALRDALR